MKKELIVLFIMAMFIAGCTTDSGSTSDTTPFIGGTQNVEISFEEDAPPAEVYAGNQYPFDIILNLDNQGEYDVMMADMSVQITGVEPGLFGLSQLQQQPQDDLLGTKKDVDGNIIDGSTTIVEFTDLNYQEDLDATIDNLPIRANVCFQYGTKARSKLCVKQDVLDRKDSDICLVNEEKNVHSSAAPVQITQLRETAQGTNKLAFTFTVKHMGLGYLYNRGTDCADDRTNENKVWINIDTGLQGLTCSGITPDGGSTTSGTVNLGTNGERTLRCTLDVGSVVTDFEKSISFELIYDYQKFVETALTVRPNLG